MKETVIVLHPLVQTGIPVLNALATVLGPARMVEMDPQNGINVNDARRVLICAPASEDICLTLKWVANNSDELCASPSVSLVEIGNTEESDSWAMDAQIQIHHPHSPGLAARLRVDDLQEAIDFALAIKSEEMQPSEQIPGEVLKSHIEEFLGSHNTCTLSTNILGQAHGTPLEYRYGAGHIYFLSEGGQKFAGLLLDNRVAISVYDSFSGFSHLAGLQLSGSARLPENGTPEYRRGVEAFGLSMERIGSLPCRMNVIDVRLNSGTFLWSDFKQSGCDARQVYCFETGE